MRSISKLTQLAKQGETYRDWYTNAEEQIRHISDYYGCDPKYLASVIAITSPRVQIGRNCSIALHYMEHNILPSGVLGNTRAALHHWRLTGDILGPKTLAFRENLIGNHEPVVLDTWMAKALRVQQSGFKNKGFRTEAIRRIKKAAQALSWKPADAQAAIWASTIKMFGRTPRYLPLVEKFHLTSV